MIQEHTSTDGKVDALLLRVKVVPGSSRDQIAGKLGDRLKIKVAAAPEKGLANQAVIRLISKLLSLAPRDVSIESGHTNPEKTVRLVGIDLATASTALNAAIVKK